MLATQTATGCVRLLLSLETNEQIGVPEGIFTTNASAVAPDFITTVDGKGHQFRYFTIDGVEVQDEDVTPGGQGDTAWQSTPVDPTIHRRVFAWYSRGGDTRGGQGVQVFTMVGMQTVLFDPVEAWSLEPAYFPEFTFADTYLGPIDLTAKLTCPIPGTPATQYPVFQKWTRSTDQKQSAPLDPRTVSLASGEKGAVTAWYVPPGSGAVLGPPSPPLPPVPRTWPHPWINDGRAERDEPAGIVAEHLNRIEKLLEQIVQQLEERRARF